MCPLCNSLWPFYEEYYVFLASQYVPYCLKIDKSSPDSFFTNAWMHAFKHVAEAAILAEQYARARRALTRSLLQSIFGSFLRLKLEEPPLGLRPWRLLEFVFEQLDDRLFMKGFFSSQNAPTPTLYTKCVTFTAHASTVCWQNAMRLWTHYVAD